MSASVKLWKDKKTQELYENQADLYAIIKATEKLEKAYVRGEYFLKDSSKYII
jgi:hypothetical protein